jgi:hypothetical protein
MYIHRQWQLAPFLQFGATIAAYVLVFAVSGCLLRCRHTLFFF